MSEWKEPTPHPMYRGEVGEGYVGATEPILVHDGLGSDTKVPLRINTHRPTLPDGTQWDQRDDAARNMRYAATLNLPQLTQRLRPRLGRAIIVGGAPSIKDRLEEIRGLAADKRNAVFAINWSHTWLIDNGIVPDNTVFFEIDAEPETVLKRAHPDVTYYICSHCDPRTFDALKDHKRVLWHSIPNSEGEHKAHEELFPEGHICGGGIGTFTRTLTVSMFLGFRHFDIFGCDSSFPDDGKTHVEGYSTIMDAEKDGFFVYAKSDQNVVRRFRTLGYLALQHEEFKEYCRINHAWFSCQVHDDGLLGWSHQQTYPEQYE